MKIYAPQLHTNEDTSIDINVGSNAEFRLSGSGELHVDGDIVAFSTEVSSDERLKDNIQNISEAVEKIKQLNGVEFTWKRDGEPSAGVIAQDVEQVLPQAVRESRSLNSDLAYKRVNYNALLSVIIESIKELEARIAKLEE